MQLNLSSDQQLLVATRKNELLTQAGLRRRLNEKELAAARAKLHDVYIPERYATNSAEYSALND